MTARLLTRIALLLSYAGLFVSGILSIAELKSADVPCGVSGGCHTVAMDPSSHLLFGLSNAYLGLGAYLVFAILASMRLLNPGAPRFILLFAYIASVAGTAFSGYLTYLELFQIHAICVWCVSSAIIVTLLLFVHAAEFQITADQPAQPASGRFDFGAVVALPLIAFLAIAGLGAGLTRGPSAIKAPITQGTFERYPLVPGGAQIYGRHDAPVTIVEFADLQCPVCRHDFPKLKDIVSQSNGKIRLVFRHFPLPGQEHNMALPAAALAEYAATKGKFFEFVGAFYTENEDNETTPLGILNVAKSVGLDVADAQQAIVDEKSVAFRRVQEDSAASAQYGLISTPTFFVFGPGQELHPDVTLFSGLEDLLKTPKYQQAMGNG